MNVLITGTAGRIGQAIAKELGGTHRLTGVDRLPGACVDERADICDKTAMQRLLTNQQVVVHTAALHAPHVGVETDDAFRAINVEATKQLASLAWEAGVQHFVFTSTTALYGHASTAPGKTNWINEAVSPRPRTIYHHCKCAAEQWLEQFAIDSGIPVTVLQMSRCFPEPANQMAIYRLHRGVDARDVALAHRCALEQRLSGFRRYIISGHTPFSQADLVDLYSRADAVIGRKVPELASEFGRRGWALPGSIDRVYDASLAHQELGWQARHGFQSVLQQLDQNRPEVLPAVSS